MLHVAFARSDIARGRIVRLDADAGARGRGCRRGAHRRRAERRAGGPDGRDAGALDGIGGAVQGARRRRAALRRGSVRAGGGATSRALAEDAVELIELEVEPLPAGRRLRDGAREHRARAPRVETATSPARCHAARRRAARDLRVGGARRDRDVRPEPLPRGADGGPRHRRVVATACAVAFDVWVSTQSPHDVRTVTSRITGVPESRIRVRMGDVGGGFGQKAYLARDEQIVLLASFHLGLPLKWIEDRAREPRRGDVVARRAVHRDHRGRRRRHDPGHRGRPPRRRRRVPDGRQRGRHGRGDLHRALPHPEDGVRVAVGVHQHVSTRAVPRAVAVRDVLPRAGHRPPRPTAWASTRWSCGAATCCSATSCPYTHAPRHPDRSTCRPRRRSSRPRRWSTTTRSASGNASEFARRPPRRRRHRAVHRAADA